MLLSRSGKANMSTRKYQCGVCGYHDLADRMVYSTSTRQRYCSSLTACRKRARKRGKEKAHGTQDAA